MERIGLIISAGKQTRFGSEIPKALMEFDGKPIAKRSIEILEKFCDEVYVVTSFDNNSYFIDKGIHQTMPIESGLGCGDAVYKAVHTLLKSKKNFQVIICWGDTILDEFVIGKSLQIFDLQFNCNVMPCETIESPYVQISEIGNGYLDVKYSKYNEKTTKGYHDLSLFFLDAVELDQACEKFREMHFVGERYVHEHGNEFTFLDLFKEKLLKCKIVPIESTTSKSFNTLEEFKQL